MTKTFYVSFGRFFLSIQPKCNPTFLSSIKRCIELKDNDKSEFNFVLVKLCTSKMEWLLFRCVLDAVIATQKCSSRYSPTAAVSYIQFLHSRFQKSIPDWCCLEPAEDKNVKRDANAFVMLSAPYFYDKSDNAL